MWLFVVWVGDGAKVAATAEQLLTGQKDGKSQNANVKTTPSQLFSEKVATKDCIQCAVFDAWW